MLMNLFFNRNQGKRSAGILKGMFICNPVLLPTSSNNFVSALGRLPVHKQKDAAGVEEKQIKIKCVCGFFFSFLAFFEWIVHLILMVMSWIQQANLSY